MVRRVGSEYARQHLAELLERAARGETTIVTRREAPLAAIVPLEAMVTEEAGAPSILALSGSGAGLWGDDPAAWVADAREEWS